MKLTHLVLISTLIGLMCVSCGSKNLMISKVGYQSVRLANPKDPAQTSEAKLIAGFTITKEGALNVMVKNNTNEILIIDQTQSFFIKPDGSSVCYYDPTITTTTTTDIHTTTKGASLNMGAVANVLGIGGALGTLAGGLNVGGSGTSGQSTSNTVYKADLPKISIGPRGSGWMTKEFSVDGIGYNAINNSSSINNTVNSYNEALKRFTVCLTFSVDGGETYDKLISDFYVNTEIVVPVTSQRFVNESVRQIYSLKPDAVNEGLWLLIAPTNIKSGYDGVAHGSLIDFK